MRKDIYESPLSSRYASEYMLHLFSPDMRFQTWRRLWVALARAEHELGLPITQEQVDELAAHITDIDYEVAEKREHEVRHDVMAHVYAYGKAAPSAAGIIHLGATSCYVTDNADLVLYRDGLKYLRGQLLSVMVNLAAFAREYAATPTLGYTHYQPAQPVTIGKRRCGCRTSARTLKSLILSSARCASSAAAARRARRRALSTSSRATVTRLTR